MKRITLLTLLVSCGANVPVSEPDNTASQPHVTSSQSTNTENPEPVEVETVPAEAIEHLDNLTDEWFGEGTLIEKAEGLQLNVDVDDKTHTILNVPSDAERGDCRTDPDWPEQKDLEKKRKKNPKHHFDTSTSESWWKFIGKKTAVAVRFRHDAVQAYVWDASKQCVQMVNLTTVLFADWKGTQKRLHPHKTETQTAMKDAKRTFQIAWNRLKDDIDREGPVPDPVVHRRDIFPAEGSERVILSDNSFRIEDANRNTLYTFPAVKDASCMRIQVTGYKMGDDAYVRFNATYHEPGSFCLQEKEDYYEHSVSVQWSNDRVVPVKQSQLVSSGWSTYSNNDSVTGHRLETSAGALTIEMVSQDRSGEGFESKNVKCSKRDQKEGLCEPGWADGQWIQISTTWTFETRDGVVIPLGEGNFIHDHETPSFECC